MISPRRIALAAALAACGIAAAAPADDLEAFARAHGGKFAQEIPASAWPHRLTLEALMALPLGTAYSEVAGALQLPDSARPLSALTIRQQCRPAGSFVGRNAVGATATIQRQACTELRVTIDTPARPPLAGIEISMSAPDARAALAARVLPVVIDFDVRNAPGVQPAVVGNDVERGTPATPVQIDLTSLDVLGTVAAIRMRDGRVIWQRPP